MRRRILRSFTFRKWQMGWRQGWFALSPVVGCSPTDVSRKPFNIYRRTAVVCNRMCPVLFGCRKYFRNSLRSNHAPALSFFFKFMTINCFSAQNIKITINSRMLAELSLIYKYTQTQPYIQNKKIIYVYTPSVIGVHMSLKPAIEIYTGFKHLFALSGFVKTGKKTWALYSC